MIITLKEKILSPSGIVSHLTFVGEEQIQFKEGQFMMLDTEIEGHHTKRAYSIASTFIQAKETNEISFVIKKVSENGMSDYLTEKIKVGDRINMTGPYGHMINDHSQSNYLLISIGSGLAPIMSHYQRLIYDGNFGKIAHIYGERFYGHILPNFHDIFQDTENAQHAFYLSKEENIPEGYQRGHVQNGLQQALDYLDTKDIKVYACGLPAMVDEVRAKLIEYGIPSENIKFEKY